ncbi:MAG: ABC transporter permease subunit [Methanobacteriota archaeon]|nr:MAG: ABC transporter permease subunit [Euryarchaeota archaeon]
MAIPLDELVNITLLTVAVTIGATALGSLLGIPLGLLLVLERFPGRGAIRTIVYALYAFPPIVAGVLLYLLLRREGPLGDLGLLFTPVAILLGETLLTTPLIAGLTVSAVAELPPEVIEIVDSGGPSLRQRAIALLREARFGVTAAVLVGYGRSLAEVAAALILGGNIRGETRTLGTAILLEVNQGDFEFALALSALILAQALFMAFLLRRLQRAERAFAHRIDTSHGRPKRPTSEKTGVEG